MAFEVDRARGLLVAAGPPLARSLRGRFGLAVWLFVGGGRSALSAIERAGYDVLGERTKSGVTRRARDTLAALAAGGRA
jgi:phytoene/squalene synthetase